MLLHRKRDDLPRDLVERGGDLDQMITIAGEAFESKACGAAGVVATTRQQLKRLCPSYQPSRSSVGEIDCASGETNGEPVRPGCLKCIAGQFTPKGKFIGEIFAVPELLETASLTNNV